MNSHKFDSTEDRSFKIFFLLIVGVFFGAALYYYDNYYAIDVIRRQTTEYVDDKIKTANASSYHATYGDSSLKIKEFFAEARIKSEIFADYMMENGRKSIPQDEYQASQWIQSKLDEYIFTRNDLKNLAEYSAISFAQNLQAEANTLSRAIEFDHHFSTVNIINIDTEALSKSYAELVMRSLNLAEVEQKNWVPREFVKFGTGVVLGKVATKSLSSLWAAAGAKKGVAYSIAGGVLGLVAQFGFDWWAERSAKSDIVAGINARLTELEAHVKLTVLFPLEEERTKLLSEWKDTLSASITDYRIRHRPRLFNIIN